MKRRPKVWPLAALYRHRPCAVAVWLALSDLAGERGSIIVTPTRAELSKRTGANLKSVSAGLTLLELAGWIDRVHVPIHAKGKQTATVLRVILRRRGRSTPATKRNAVEGVQGPKGRGRSTPQDFPKGKRPVPVESNRPTAYDSTPGPAPLAHEDKDEGPARPIAEILGLTKGKP